MYRKVLTTLEQRNECNSPRRAAILNAIWHEARALAALNITEATAVVEWIWDQDKHFALPVSSLMNCLYRVFGFNVTERIARARRTLLHALE